MIRLLLIALALMAGAGQAMAQERAPAPETTYSQADLWTRRGDRIIFNPARISVPIQAGTTRVTRTAETSQEGRGLDNALLYFSPDEAVFVTVYIYAPALPDAGLTGFMTDYVLEILSGPTLRRLASGAVAAGGRDGVAIRLDYAGAREQRLASSAAFIRAGRWIVKLRVSGPEARRAEVEAATTALLQGIRFEGALQPAPATPISVAPCRADSSRPARMVADDDAETAAEAIVANAAVDLPGVMEDMSAYGWCRSAGYRIAGAPGATPVLRNLGPQTPASPRRRVLIALLADNGTMFEVIERRLDGRTRYVLLHHQIGRTLLLGSYDAVPTDDQLRALAAGEDREGGRARAVITYQAGGGSSISIQTRPAPGQPTT